MTEPKGRPGFIENSGARFERAVRSLFEAIKPDKSKPVVSEDAKPTVPEKRDD